MNLALALKAALLGFIEGLTEFLPVSSTGHLILFGHYLGFNSPGHSFEVLIQLGAILAILSVYFGKLWYLAKGMFSDRKAQMFIAAVLLAFLPAVVIGVFAHSFIKSVLFTPFVVCISLISGGLILLVVDETRFETKIHDVMDIPLVTALKIGLFQCLAMIPGVSRSGATIVGALLMGADKRAAPSPGTGSGRCGRPCRRGYPRPACRVGSSRADRSTEARSRPESASRRSAPASRRGRS